MTQVDSGVVRPSAQRGAVLVLALLMLFIGSVLALSLLFVTEAEVRTSGSFEDHNKALVAAEAGVQEVLWRLRLLNKPALDPVDGSRATGFGLPNDNGYINPDRNYGTPPAPLTGALVGIPSIQKQEGNLIDDDGDDVDGDGIPVDEVDELNVVRGWGVRIVDGYTYSASDQQIDDNPTNPGQPALGATTSPDGDRLVLPSLLRPEYLFGSTAQNRGTGRLYYTVPFADRNSPDVLSVRFLRESDFNEYCRGRSCESPPNSGIADFTGNGVNDLVYYDDSLKTNLRDADPQSIAGSGDGTFDNESPYNVDRGGANRATGFPVLVITSTGRVEKSGRIVARRRLEVRVSYEFDFTNSAAVCSCNNVRVSGNSKYYSYDSRMAGCNLPWVSPCDHTSGRQADIASNRTVEFSGGSAEVFGSVRGFESVIVSGGASPTIAGVSQSRGAIDAGVCPAGRCYPNDLTMTKPCLCVNIVQKVQERAPDAMNDMDNVDADGEKWVKPSMDRAFAAGCAVAGPATNYATTDPVGPINSHTAEFSTGTWWFREGGHYYFRRFNVTGNARIVGGPRGSGPNASCDITVRPKVTRPINFYVEEAIAIANNADWLVFEKLRPSEYIVWLMNSGMSCGPTANCIRFGPNNYKLTLVAPDTTADFSGNAHIAGSLVMKESPNSALGGTPYFYYDQNLREVYGGTRKPVFVNWREVE